MQLGISSHTWAWSIGVPGYEKPDLPFTPWTLLDKAVELGVRVVQFADNLPLDTLPGGERQRLVQQAEKAGLTLEVGIAGIDRDELRRGLALAVETGSPILRTLIDTKSHEPDVDEVVTILRSMAKDFEREKVVLAIENHDRFKSATLRQIVERIDSPAVGICFDTSNSIGCLESAEQVLETLKPYVVNVHVKDYCIFRPKHMKGFIVEGRAAGRGQLDIPGILAQVKTLAEKTNVILEMWSSPQATLPETITLESRCAEESVQYLRQFLPN